jgi:hypothetical protein
MTRAVEAKIEAIEKPFSIMVAFTAIGILGLLYGIFISSAVESVARADSTREHIADLYTKIGTLESSYALVTGTIDADEASLAGYVNPASVSYIKMNQSGLSFVSPIDTGLNR